MEDIRSEFEKLAEQEYKNRNALNYIGEIVLDENSYDYIIEKLWEFVESQLTKERARVNELVKMINQQDDSSNRRTKLKEHPTTEKSCENCKHESVGDWEIPCVYCNIEKDIAEWESKLKD